MKGTVTLRAGHIQPVWTGHPWVFAQAIQSIAGSPGAGDEVDVMDPRGSFLGRGLYSPGSAIPVRIYTRRDEPVDRKLFEQRLDAAIRLRRELLDLPSADTTGYRLVHAEGDGLPGLIVDVYGSVLAVQALTAGVARRLEDVYDALQAKLSPAAIVALAPPSRVAAKEKLEGRTGVVRGKLTGAPKFRERGLSLTAQVEGQKTGYYVDQRENRSWIETLARGRRVLDVFTFTGGFALAAARGGAREVFAVDSSAAALALAAEHAVENGFGSVIRFHRGDARKDLGGAGWSKPFDLVVLDPPRLAQSRKELDGALRLYRHLNAMAMRKLDRGGVLLSCSCSQLVSQDDLLRAIALGARDADRTATILRLGGQGPDHPVPAAFPEGRYLKAALVCVT